jgi:membrane-associated phospholipid phosphatase
MVRRPTALLAAAGACAALAGAVYACALHVGVLQRVDLRVLEGFVELRSARTAPPAHALAHLFDPVPFALLAAAVLALGVAVGRRRPALAAAVAMGGAAVTTQLLKPLLAAHRPDVAGAVVGAEAWPSGHTTAAMSLALALVLVSPPRLRGLAAGAGGLLVVGVVYAILLLAWHYPSDVLGGFLVATAWTCLAAAGVERAGALPRPRALLGPAALAAAVPAAALVAAAALQPDALARYATEQTTFVAGAALLAAGAVALATALSLILSPAGGVRPDPAATGRSTPRAPRRRS